MPPAQRVHELLARQAGVSAVRLANGRILSFAEYGDPAGTPVLFFPGLGNTRLARHPDAELTAASGTRLIALDRPGIGFSDRASRLPLQEAAREALEVADALGIDEFNVLGWSWGGAYALALAAVAPQRVRRVALVSGMPGALYGRDAVPHLPMGIAGWAVSAVHYIPLSMQPLLWQARRSALRYPEESLARIFAGSGPADRAVLSQPGMRHMFMENMVEVWRQGIWGIYDDIRRVAAPWSFPLSAVGAPVQIWQGESDRVVPPEIARWAASNLPDAHLNLVPGEEHLLLFARWSEILAGLNSF